MTRIEKLEELKKEALETFKKVQELSKEIEGLEQKFLKSLNQLAFHYVETSINKVNFSTETETFLRDENSGEIFAFL